jgi:hypothetical protein
MGSLRLLAGYCPVLHVPDWKLLQCFWYGLQKDDAMRLNGLSKGFLCTWTLLWEKRSLNVSRFQLPLHPGR